jgi:hypothetical protein
MGCRRVGSLPASVVGIAILAASFAHAQTSLDVVAQIRAEAAKDDADSLFALAIIYEVGRDLPRDSEQSLRLLQRAAAKGHPPAQTHLGLLYQTGTAVTQDDARAFGLFSTSAAAGDTEGRYRLGMSFGYGIGTPKNPEQSLRWLAAAANQGHQEAQFALGVMLQQGTGGTKNGFAARRWLRQAAAGPDRELVSQAAPIVEQLEQHLLYSGISGEQLLLGVAATFFVAAIAADAMGVDAAFRDDPSHPLNPRNYDAFGPTKRQRDCQFRSVRGGLAVTSGRGAFPVYSGPSWACF